MYIIYAYIRATRVTINRRQLRPFVPKTPEDHFFRNPTRHKPEPCLSRQTQWDHIPCLWCRCWSPNSPIRPPPSRLRPPSLTPPPWRPWPAGRLRATSAGHPRATQPVTVSPGCVCRAGRAWGVPDEPVRGPRGPPRASLGVSCTAPFFPTFRRNSKNSCMITKPEPMFTPADVMGPRTTPLVPVVVTIFTRETPARLPPSRF